MGLPLPPQASHVRAPEAGSSQNVHCTGPRAGSFITEKTGWFWQQRPRH